MDHTKYPLYSVYECQSNVNEECESNATKLKITISCFSVYDIKNGSSDPHNYIFRFSATYNAKTNVELLADFTNTRNDWDSGHASTMLSRNHSIYICKVD